MNSFLTVFAVKPPAPLGAVSAGQSDLQPAAIRINFGNPFPDAAQELKSPRILALGAFDLGFVLVYLVPLALIALGGTRMAREQDSGILRVIAAQPIAARTVAAAKFGALAVVVVPTISAAALVSLWMAGGIGGGASAGSLLVLAALVALYCLFWIALCAAAVSLWRGAVAALATLVLGWAAMTVLLPAVGALLLDLVHPAPSRTAYVDESRIVAERIADADDAGPQWFATRADLVRINPGAGESSEVGRFARDSLNRSSLLDSRKRFEAHALQAAAKTSLIRLLSPALVFDGALQELAGTDPHAHLRFMASADDHAEALRRWFEPRVVANVGQPRACEACPGRLNFNAYDQVPRFKPAATGERFASQYLALLYLLGALLVAGAFARSRFAVWPK
jgi:ABC-2 type transport system permease protein